MGAPGPSSCPAKEREITMEGDERLRDLETGVLRYHGVSLEQVLGEVEYLREAGDSVLAGGSLAYGLGNQLSDLDLIVAGPTEVESSLVPLQHFIGSLRIDVWKLAQGFIEETFDRADEALASHSALHGSFGDVDHEADLKLLNRIAFGLVIDGEELEPARERDYRAVASDLVVREYAERMRTSALLAQLALRAGRSVAAAVNARQAVEEALNAAIARRKLPFSGDKWLGERLTGEAIDLAATYEPFRQLPESPERESARFLEKALATCTRLWGFDLGIEALTPAASWQNTDLQLFEVGEDRLLLSPGFGALWSLEENEGAAWSRLVSASTTEEPEATWGLEDCDEEALVLCLHLYEDGALDLRWASGVTIDDLEAAGRAPA